MAPRTPPPPEAPLGFLALDPERPEPMYRQVYEGIRTEILSGRLRAGQKLASTRRLANELAISRTTTVLAFDMLLAEGYLEGRAGSGTYVSEKIPDCLLHMQAPPRSPDPRDEPPPRLANRTKDIIGLREAWHPGRPVPFRMGLPALDDFPFAQWGKIAARLANAPKLLDWDYGEPAGLSGLREAIAEYLLVHRGVECSKDQVLITTGSQQGLDLCARVLVDPGEECWVEDPGYLGARAAFRSAGVALSPVPVDEEGLIVTEGVKRAPKSRAVYVTPSHQYPLGVTMSLPRRLELLAWARDADAWILEDDYDSEYRYIGKPLSPLKTLDSGQRVVYIGTFSKTLFPALRIGYLVVPDALVDPFLAQRHASSRQGPTFEQAVLERFMREGHLSRHLRRMRVLYQERQEALIEAANVHAKGLLEIPPVATGMHALAWLIDLDDKEATTRATEHGVMVAPLSSYRIQGSDQSALILCYAGYAPEAIHEGIERLAKALTT